MARPRTRVTVRNRGKQSRSRATFDAIVQAAVRVLVRDPGGFNTKAVADAAGASVGTLYQYFPSKQAIMAELIRRALAADRALFDAMLPPGGAASPDAAVERVVELALRVNERPPNLQRAMFEYLAPAEQLAHIRETHLANVARLAAFARATPGWPADVDPHFFALLALSLAASVFQLLVQHGGRAAEDTRAQLRRLLRGYLAAPAAGARSPA